MAHVVDWVMKQDGSFEFRQPELDTNIPHQYYNNYQYYDEDVTKTNSDGFVIETEVDPYDEVFSVTGNELSQYSNEVLNYQIKDLSYYNVVRF